MNKLFAKKQNKVCGYTLNNVKAVSFFFVQLILKETRTVTVCNKCHRRPLILTLIPGCDLTVVGWLVLGLTAL